MPEGGQLVLETASVVLDEAYCQRHVEARPGPHVMLAISDTGIGMNEAVRERLFEPFFTTKPKGRGTGLGLATTYGIVKQAGGSIEVYSELDRGTSFKIYLPEALEDPLAPLEDRGEPGELPRGSETVLVVEDDPIVLELARALLERQGYRVLVAADGAKALATSESEARIDLLITDVVMPGMNGRELAERLRALRPGLRVLYTSGYTENVIVHHGVVDAAVQFLAKPYEQISLVRKVRQVLDG
jgi:CheY-like chemotaxis protein